MQSTKEKRKEEQIKAEKETSSFALKIAKFKKKLFALFLRV